MSVTIFTYRLLHGTHTITSQSGTRRYKAGDVFRTTTDLLEAHSPAKPGREQFKLISTEEVERKPSMAELTAPIYYRERSYTT